MCSQGTSSHPIRTAITAPLLCFQRIEGVLAEKYFETLASNRGWTITHSTAAEDRAEKWDYQITKGELSYKVDVKSIKKVSRKDLTPQDELLWVEVHKKVTDQEITPGWLYMSIADIIAFECFNDFILVDRKQLAELVDKKTDMTSKVTSPERAVNKLYYRKRINNNPGHEALTLIEAAAVRKIAVECWEKSELMKPLAPPQCAHVTSSESEFHKEALRSIGFKSSRLREKRESEIKSSIIQFQYCPLCSAKLL